MKSEEIKTTATISGGYPLSVKTRGGAEIKIEVKELSWDMMIKLVNAADDWLTQVKLCTGLTVVQIESLTDESIDQIREKIDILNFPKARRWMKHQSAFRIALFAPGAMETILSEMSKIRLQDFAPKADTIGKKPFILRRLARGLCFWRTDKTMPQG